MRGAKANGRRTGSGPPFPRRFQTSARRTMTPVSGAGARGANRARIVAAVAPPEPRFRSPASRFPVPPDSSALCPARGKMRATPRCRAPGRPPFRRTAGASARRSHRGVRSVPRVTRSREAAGRPTGTRRTRRPLRRCRRVIESDAPSCAVPTGRPACAPHGPVRPMNIASTHASGDGRGGGCTLRSFQRVSTGSSGEFSIQNNDGE